MGDISTFGMFGMAKLGIYAAQKAMEVTGNNITNINTEGYTRQKVNQVSLFMGGADRYVSGWDARVGNGAVVTKINQVRDPYLDIRYRTTMADVGAANTMLDGYDQLASIFDEVGKGQGDGVLELQMNDLISQIQRLVTEGAGKDDYDTLVRGSASSLVSLFNTYADSLETLKKNQIDSFQKDIDTVNTLLTKIQELNINIRKSEIHGGQALEMQDLRNTYIDELSEYMRIDVTYESEDVGAGVMVDKLVIKLAGNDPNSDSNQQVLVNGNYVTQLSWDQKLDANGVPLEDDVSKEYNDQFWVKLAALKDQNGRTLELSRTKGADDKWQIEYSKEVVLNDNDLYGSLQSTRELLTEEGEYASKDIVDMHDQGAAGKRGIPYYQNMLDALANKFATVLNEANTLPDYKVADPMYSYYNGGPLFSNRGDGNDTTGITAANIAISKAWATGDVRVLCNKEPVDPDRPESTNNSNLVHILYLIQEGYQDYRPSDIPQGEDAVSKDVVFFSGTFQGMLTEISSTLANDTRVVTNKLQNHVSAANDLYLDKDSVSGVDLNDEAMAMMQYNKAYSASCRLLTTLDEMLDKLINGTAI